MSSRELFSAVASELYGKTVLIASGGIDSAEEAYARTELLLKGELVAGKTLKIGVKAGQLKFDIA